MDPYASRALGPAADYNARPAPLHYGDLFGADAGFSTVYQSGPGYDVINGVQEADVASISRRSSAASMAAPAPALNWMQTAGAGVLLLLAGAIYLEGRVLR